MNKTLIKLALSIGSSLVIVALLLQMFSSGISDAERPAIIPLFQSVSAKLIIAYLGLFGIALFVRAYRYQSLISLAGEHSVPSMKDMLLVTGIRNMVVDMLPARLGELGYVGLLNRGYGVKLSHCVSSLSLTIALDFIALLSIVIAILVAQTLGEGISTWAVGAAILASLLVVIAFVGLFWILPTCVLFLEKQVVKKRMETDLSAPQPNTKQAWLIKGLLLLKEFNNSLQEVRQSGRGPLLIACSILIRVLKYLGFYLLFLAVTENNFPELAVLPVEHVVSALIGGEVAASLPIPAFMGFGVYEAGSVLMFNLLGISDLATLLLVMLCVHILSQLFEYCLGGLLLLVFFWRKRQQTKTSTSFFGKAEKSNSKTITTAIVALIGGAAIVFFAYQLRASSKLGSLSPPESGQALNAAQGAGAVTTQEGLDGFVVFSSNRDGNHDIFKRELTTFELTKLTNHPHTETYPRLSPDGRALVYSRAQQVWVSQRNVVAWDVYWMDLATLEHRKIASNSTSPLWLNAREITVLRDGRVVEKIDINTLEATIVFESGVDNKMPKGVGIYNPSLNDETQQLAFTARQSYIGSNTGHWGTAINSGSEHLGVANGCELSWSVDKKQLFQVSPNAVDGTNEFIQIEPETGAITTLLNLKGEFTHEYWPKQSSDGNYLVFGASRGKEFHEHDTEDYEIFLWKFGSNPNKATRLTFHTGNDNWPDVHIRREQ